MAVKGWQNQTMVYLVMWKSKRAENYTLSRLMKTEDGKDKLVEALIHFGYDPEEIVVVEQDRIWVPEKKVKKNRKGGRK